MSNMEQKLNSEKRLAEDVVDNKKLRKIYNDLAVIYVAMPLQYPHEKKFGKTLQKLLLFVEGKQIVEGKQKNFDLQDNKSNFENAYQFIKSFEYIVMVNKSKTHYPKLNSIERGQKISSMWKHDRKEYNRLKKEWGVK